MSAILLETGIVAKKIQAIIRKQVLCNIYKQCHYSNIQNSSKKLVNYNNNNNKHVWHIGTYLLSRKKMTFGSQVSFYAFLVIQIDQKVTILRAAVKNTGRFSLNRTHLSNNTSYINENDINTPR